MDKDLVIVDYIINALLIPSGFSTIYGMKFPARRTGHLRAKEHTVFMTAYAFYAYSFTRMKSAYKYFVARFASDLNRLQNPCLPIDELRQLIKSVYETRGLQEGMFPDSEKQFVFHEIVDIVNHVIQLGHVSGIMCYSGERSLSTIGRMRAKGGVHYVKGLFYKYIALENTYQFDTSVPDSFKDNSQPNFKYSDFVLKLCGGTETLKLNTFEMNALFDSVFNYLEVEVNEPVIVKSNFMRLRKVYFTNKVKNPIWKTRDFYSWVVELDSRYRAGSKQSVTAIDFSDLVISFT
jgi:hypothetical protein